LSSEEFIWHHIAKRIRGGLTIYELKDKMTYTEFLSWKRFIEQEIENERDEQALTLWYFAHLCFYVHDLKYILGGNNTTTPKDFYLKLQKPKEEEQKKLVLDSPIVDEEIMKDQMEMEKAYIGLMLGLNYAQIKRDHKNKIGNKK
jgi:hypothetical protein